MKTTTPNEKYRSALLLAGATVLFTALSPSVRASAVLDAPIPIAINTTTPTAVSQSFTVSSGATVLVVELVDHNSNTENNEPALLTWGAPTAQSIVKAVSENNISAPGRDATIYYLFNPTPGAYAITGTTASGDDYYLLTAYTLTGVNTTVAPLTNAADANGPLTISFNVAGVPANAWAAVAGLYSTTGGGLTITSSSGTVNTASATNASTVATLGYVSGLASGTATFTETWTASNGSKSALVAAIFTPSAAGTVPTAGPITLSTTNQLYAGVPVTLSETPLAGTVPFTYQWQTDGGLGGSLVNITGAANTTYTVNTSAFVPGTAYKYDVVVSNGAGSSTSAVTNLVVATPVAPYLLADITPLNPTAGLGGNLTFAAQFNGGQPITYQWQENTGSGLVNLLNATNSSLTLSSLTYASIGLYQVVALNSLGQATSSPSLLTISGQANAVTINSLLMDMTNRDRLATVPNPAYYTRENTSYDRHSTSPTNLPNWWANNDYNYFLYTNTYSSSRIEYVMMDAAGPGAIVSWTKADTDPDAIFRVYLDGSTNPVIAENNRWLLGGVPPTAQELAFTNNADSRRVPRQFYPSGPVVYPIQSNFLGGYGTIPAPFSGTYSLGCDLYLPITYSNHCIVTYEPPESNPFYCSCYYKIIYRTYATNTVVQSFNLAQLQDPTVSNLINQVGEVLTNPLPAVQASLASQTTPQERVLAPGGFIQTNLTGAGALRLLQITYNPTNPVNGTRSTFLSVVCDGLQTVWCPVGDFFGSGVGINPVATWDYVVQPNGVMSCYWVMPFTNSCTVMLTNTGGQAVDVTLGPLGTGAWLGGTNSMHFRSYWHDQEIPTVAGNGTMDWNFLTATNSVGVANGSGTGVFNGAGTMGVYVGETLVVHNNPPAGVGHTWWGEGDEKIYLNGEGFPSSFGTGTEDYYGYSFGGSASIFFQSPFLAHSQIAGDTVPAGAGGAYTAPTRVRMLDAYPYASSIRFDMEVWAWDATVLEYAVNACWYDCLPAANDFNFTMAQPPAAPATASVYAGDNATYNVKVGSLNAFTGAISLTATNLPPGATAAFAPISGTNTGASTLTVSTTAGVTLAGNYPLMVTGASGTNIHSLTLNLFVEPLSARIAWSAPVPVTTADATLKVPGTLAGAYSVAGAESFYNNEVIVTLANGSNLDFKADGSVATATGSGTSTGAFNGPNTGVFMTNTTGNANFDTVLNGFNSDGGPKTITLNNLIPGQQYAVQLFGLDDRQESDWPFRQACFQNSFDPTDVSATFCMSNNVSVIGTFTAAFSTQTIEELLPGTSTGADVGDGNINALVVYNLSGPVITTQPQTQQNFPGWNTTLTVAAGGTPPFAYQWRFNGANLADGVGISGSQSNTLTIYNLSPAEVGAYTVVISNSTGSVTSSIAALTINSLVSIPALLDVGASGPNAGLNDICQFSTTGNGPDGNWYWWGSGSGARIGQTFTTLTNNAAGYVLNSVAFKVGGTGSGGNFTFPYASSFILDLYQLSTDRTTATPMATCTLNGTINADGDWFDFYGLSVPLSPGTTYAYAFGNTVSGNWENLATVPNDPYTGGQVCTIPDAGGTINYDGVAIGSPAAYSDVFDLGLTTILAPQILIQPLSQTNFLASTAIFNAGAIGSAPLAYQWQFNGLNLTDRAGISGSQSNALTLSNVNLNEAGSYTVVVTNNAGSVTSAPAILTLVTAQQIALQDGSPTSITSTAGHTLTNTFTVTAGASVLVAELTTAYPGGTADSVPTLSWGGQVLNRAVWQDTTAQTERDVSIFYLWNPPAGTSNITMVANSGVTNTWLVAYTLAGVDTNALPVTGSAGNSGSITSISVTNVAGIGAGAFAAVDVVSGGAPGNTLTLAGSSGTISTASASTTTGTTATTTMGCFTNLASGTASFTTTATVAGKMALAATVFAPAVITTGAPKVVLSIAAAAGGGQTLTWTAGTLLQATNLAGPWVTNPAVGSYTVMPTNALMFFKVRVE